MLFTKTINRIIIITMVHPNWRLTHQSALYIEMALAAVADVLCPSLE